MHRSELLELRDLIAERLDLFEIDVLRSELCSFRGRWTEWTMDVRTRRVPRRSWRTSFAADLVNDQHYVAVTKIENIIRGLLRS